MGPVGGRVLRTGRGIPVSLSVVLAAVAARGGVRLHFVAAPGHFLTRFDVREGPAAGQSRWVDAFGGGRIMDWCPCPPPPPGRLRSWERSMPCRRRLAGLSCL